MSVVLSLFHAAQACASVGTGLLSAMAIYNLKQREGQAETAAQWSNMAAHQLHKTRTTQTIGALATVSSLVSSVILAIGPSSDRSKWPFMLSLTNAIGIALTYKHLRNFWRNKAKALYLSDYNEGITASNQMRQVLGVLAVSWAVVTVMYLWQLTLN
ncbi:uncharacterized protein Z518_04955 [Rhinocladiella mackenziei CBS 650.93]|uniref:DUF1772 domain-containing protein n=1 Tax=Rhinocladiella mackenziei CBS 650.93 TaxID=1442369 RepID=A0A0D2IMK4_9EURO|nr:uncharacterized protein Z518_04955 [Rhinocladiella mackenziei CBS 650.93]KIX06979.1 hypothetical protein Z518_04955 [Rhinocladiella mackenziei CBS 650.93]